MTNKVYLNMKISIVIFLAGISIISLIMVIFFKNVDDNIVSLPIKSGDKIIIYEKDKNTFIEVKHVSMMTSLEIPQVLIEYYSIYLERLRIGIIMRTIYLDYYRLKEDVFFRDPGIITKLAHNSLVINQKRVPCLTKEALLAYKIFKKYSSDKILEFYLNKTYFGHGIFGFKAASQYYFGKNISQLQIHEIAFLISISMDFLHTNILEEEKARLNFENAKVNRDKILEKMAGRKIITTEQAEKFKNMPLIINY